MKGRKAQVKVLIGMIAITIVLFLIVRFYFGNISPEIKEGIDIESCRATIKTASAIREKGEGFSPVKLNCPAVLREFDVLKDSARTVETAIATELSNCWYKTAGSENRIAKNYWQFDRLANDPNVCIVCSTLNIRNGVVDTNNINKYIKERNLFSTSWPDHYFIEPKKKIEDFGILSDKDSITISPTNWLMVDKLAWLEPDKTYYVVDINAPAEKDDYVHVFIVSKDNLEKVRCDVLYHEI